MMASDPGNNVDKVRLDTEEEPIFVSMAASADVNANDNHESRTKGRAVGLPMDSEQTQMTNPQETPADLPGEERECKSDNVADEDNRSSAGEEEFHSPCASPEHAFGPTVAEQEETDSENSDTESTSSSCTSSSEGEYNVRVAESFGINPECRDQLMSQDSEDLPHVDTVQGMIDMGEPNEPLLLPGNIGGVGGESGHRESGSSVSSVTEDDILPHFPGPDCVFVTDEVSDDVFEGGRADGPAKPVQIRRQKRKSSSYRVIKNRAGSLEIIRIDPIDVTTDTEVKEALIQRNESKKKAQHEPEPTDAAATAAASTTGAAELQSRGQSSGSSSALLASDSESLHKQQTTETDQREEKTAATNKIINEELDHSQVADRVMTWQYSSENVPGTQDPVKLTGLGERTQQAISDVKQSSENAESVSAAGTGSAKSKKTTFKPQRAKHDLDRSISIPLSPEELNVSLTMFAPTDGTDSGGASKKSPDKNDATGNEDGKAASSDHDMPSPPPRRRKSKLKYSATFSAADTRASVITSRAKVHDRRDRRDRRASRFFTTPGLSSSKLESYEHEHVTLITDQLPLTFSDFPSAKRAQVALELYTTERTFLRGVETVIQVFKTPLDEFLDAKEVTTMFSNIEDIFSINKGILFNMLEKISHWSDTQCIGQIFIQAAPQLKKAYAIFCNNYDASEKLIKAKMKRKDFEGFLKNCYLLPICQPGITLPVYLISVVHRIPRYILLLKELLKRTTDRHPDYRDVEKALREMNKVAEYINNKLQALQGQRAMAELRSRVIGLKAYQVPGRSLCKQAEVTMAGSTRVYNCLLFSDLLVFACKGVLHQEVELTLELKTVWFADLEDHDPHSIKEDSLEVFTPERSYIIYAGSKSEKKVWLQKLESALAGLLCDEDADDKKQIDVRKAAFTYKDGTIYCGEFRSGKRHGQGVLAWPNQTRYVGQWEEGDRSGTGELTFTTGEKYSGQWADDKQHGKGTLVYNSGDEYRGGWAEGKMHGKGEIHFANGDRYKGDLFRGEIHGNGELTCVNGPHYTGAWVTSKKQGKGILKLADGRIYSGEFVCDRISGQGEMFYPSEATYVGQWENDERHGIGVYRHPDGTCYEGQWKQDCMTGEGNMAYANGDQYTGGWFKNMRFGKGVTTYKDGSRYEGQYQYDHRHGTGDMLYKDGARYSGSWETDQRHSKGKIVYADKSCYEGDWLNGLRHGKGTMTYANGATYQGHWEFGKENGAGRFTDPSAGYSYKGNWRKGKKNGHGVEVGRFGTFDGEWKDGMRHGPGKEEVNKGPSFEGTWKENRKHGPGKRKLGSGIEEEQIWDSGQLTAPTGLVAVELPPIQRR